MNNAHSFTLTLIDGTILRSLARILLRMSWHVTIITQITAARWSYVFSSLRRELMWKMLVSESLWRTCSLQHN